MAGTTLTLQQPTKRKRDHDLTEAIDVERDTRHQTCLECTLSWPWVIFHRNEDGSRNRKCFTCLGINDSQWELNVIRMNESISKARKKLLRIDPIAPTSSTSTPMSTTPNQGHTQSQITTDQALAITLNSNSNPNGNGQGLQYHPNPPMPYQPQPQYQAQPPPQTHFHPDHHMYGAQMIAPQYQDQFGQPLFNPAQAYGFNLYNPPIQPQQQRQQGTIHHQPQPQSANLYQPQHRLQPRVADQYPQQRQPLPLIQLQPQQPHPQPQILPPAQSHGIWTQLFKQTEPTRAMNWVMMNYHPANGAPPIPQMELYKHYASTIPRQGYPPLLQGKDFILGVAKHYGGMGVRLDKGTFTIGGLWRRNQPVATLR